MNIVHEPITGLKKQILSIIEKHLDIKKYRVFFFGSRVSGTGNEHSDIDIGIEGPEPIPFDVWSSLREDIEDISTLYTIDIVDFKQVSPQFRSVALEHIEALV